MVIFHGCTLPRGWERMYPNYVGSEAILASENMIFSQDFCDKEAFNACLHPFIRNAVGCMEYGGCFLNKRMNRDNNSGNIRRTSDTFQLATTILFQNPIQNFALAPNNLNDAPQLCIDFIKKVPTTWDETHFVDGYPGKYVVMARKHADKWYIAGVNATQTPLRLSLRLPMLEGKKNIALYTDSKNMEPVFKKLKLKKGNIIQITIQPQGGIIITD
ncbi:glycoside hydrolase family 97 [gut metagenome]|uniref:Glycoside hydrolase family 97 n=1 Tax=gut metagenome TaxID=749906 RepID=J9H2U6_9ZZZZ